MLPVLWRMPVFRATLRPGRGSGIYLMPDIWERSWLILSVLGALSTTIVSCGGLDKFWSDRKHSAKCPGRPCVQITTETVSLAESSTEGFDQCSRSLRK